MLAVAFVCNQVTLRFESELFTAIMESKLKISLFLRHLNWISQLSFEVVSRVVAIK